MLTIFERSPRRGFCDRVSRRGFLKIGGLALGGLSLPTSCGPRPPAAQRSHKAVIMIFLSGGPPHQDMFDLKPDAPAEIRGEFKPITTNVPGIEICEHLPRLAGMMDRLCRIRSLVGAEGRPRGVPVHDRPQPRRQPQGGWPRSARWSRNCKARRRRPCRRSSACRRKMQHTPYNSGQPGFLGLAYAPFKPNGEGKDDMVLKASRSIGWTTARRCCGAFDHFQPRRPTPPA